MLWWWPMLFVRMPGSGDVNQEIAPETWWSLPFSASYKAGDRALEHEVITKVAGYGSQLGTVIDALQALLIRELSADELKQDGSYTKLLGLAERIEALKTGDRARLLREDLAAYREADPEGFRLLVQGLAAALPTD